MIKLIVSDFDGTLLPYGEREVSRSVKGQIAALLEQNKTVAVSSGRTYGELAAFLSDFADRLYFICCDGAYYVKGGKLLYERKIERQDLSLFFGQDAEGFPFVLHGAERNYGVGRLPREAEDFHPIPVEREGEISEKIFKITSYGGAVRLPAYGGLRMHWDGGANSVTQYVNRFANKGAALSDLQTRLMLTRFDTACLGDSGNDVAMMRGAKESFCVGNRSAELQAVCAHRVERAETALSSLLNQSK